MFQVVLCTNMDEVFIWKHRAINARAFKRKNVKFSLPHKLCVMKYQVPCTIKNKVLNLEIQIYCLTKFVSFRVFIQQPQ